MTKNVPMLMKKEAMRIGRITLRTDTPAAFRAINSLFSPMLPTVIIEASNAQTQAFPDKLVDVDPEELHHEDEDDHKKDHEEWSYE